MSGFRIQSSKLTCLGNWKHEIEDYKENENEQPDFQIAQSCLANVSPEKFSAITAEYPELVCRLKWRNTLALKYRWNTLFCFSLSFYLPCFSPEV